MMFLTKPGFVSFEKVSYSTLSSSKSTEGISAMVSLPNKLPMAACYSRAPCVKVHARVVNSPWQPRDEKRSRERGREAPSQRGGFSHRGFFFLKIKRRLIFTALNIHSYSKHHKIKRTKPKPTVVVVR